MRGWVGITDVGIGGGEGLSGFKEMDLAVAAVAFVAALKVKVLATEAAVLKRWR